MSGIPDNIIEVLNNLSCEKVAERLGMSVTKHRTLCFMHDDHHPSMHFSGKNREWWWCFVCNKGGKAINLVMEYLDISFLEACLWLGNQFGIHVEKESARDPFRARKVLRKKKQVFAYEPSPFSEEIVQWILKNNSLTGIGQQFLYGQRKLERNVVEQLNIVSIDESRILIRRLRESFDEETLQESGLVARTNGNLYFRMFTPCLLFPYYTKERRLVGLQSRYLGNNQDAPRFQFVSAQKTCLYNIPILNTMTYGEDLYISEGVTDCLALLSSGKKAVAIPSATILPKSDLLSLAKFKLHMYPDQDDAGKKAYAKLRRFFINNYAVLNEEQLPKGVKDYCEYYMYIYGNDQ